MIATSRAWRVVQTKRQKLLGCQLLHVSLKSRIAACSNHLKDLDGFATLTPL